MWLARCGLGIWVWTMVVIFGGMYYSEDQWPSTGDSFDGTGGTPDYSQPRIRPSGARALCHLLGMYPSHPSRPILVGSMELGMRMRAARQLRFGLAG